MKILCADDEPFALDILTEAVKEADPESEVYAFTEVEPLLAFAEENRCDIAFLDIEMRETNGLLLAARLKQINPKINLIFVTGYDQFAGDAIRLRASGYVLKPVTGEKIIEELDNLRNPIPPAPIDGLRVQCFGNFDVFFNGERLSFSRSKAKELFAYLVFKRGTAISWQEAAAIVYEDEPESIQLHNRIRQLISSMMKTLRSVGAENVICRQGYRLSVDPEKMNCDYYRFLDMDVNAMNGYTGEFMAQYEWAIFVTAFLDHKQIETAKVP